MSKFKSGETAVIPADIHIRMLENFKGYASKLNLDYEEALHIAHVPKGFFEKEAWATVIGTEHEVNYVGTYLGEPAIVLDSTATLDLPGVPTYQRMLGCFGFTEDMLLTKEEFNNQNNNQKQTTMNLTGTVTKEDVRVAALRLLAVNGQTTTLEVKNHLRNHPSTNSLKSNQDEISALMAEVSKEEGWDIDSSGDYRIYSINPTAIHFTNNANNATVVAMTPVVQHPAATTTPAVPTATTSINGITHKSRTQAVAGDWEVNATTTSLVIYMDGSLSRDKVRSYFSKLTGEKFQDTRTRRIQ